LERREIPVAVPDTYERVCVARAVEEAARFAAYVAALDREDGMFAESISELTRSEPDSVPGRGSEPRAALG